MREDELYKKSFADVQELNKDIVVFSRTIDNLNESAGGSDSDKREQAVHDFIAQYHQFIEKYENSINERIQAFATKIIGIIQDNKAEMLLFGIDRDDDGRLKSMEEYCYIKEDKSSDRTVLDILNKELLNAKIYIERFIPGKYVSYDADKDYRVIQNEGNIYTRSV
ncbi:MAG: hypothetical protein IJW18_00185 [Lachnospiraceae bacterium]|nr:hypothetical protein [Lachnospiraceae bacterium]